MNKLLVPLLLALAFLAACNPKSTGGNRAAARKLKIEAVDFDYLKVRSKVQYEDAKQSVSGTANIRIKQDSLIWVSLTAVLGIEVARVRITQDSVWFVNRIEKEYAVMDFAGLSRQMNMPINFEIVQAMLTGQLMLPRQRKDQVQSQENAFLLTQNRPGLLVNNTVSAQNNKINLVEVTQQATNSKLKIEYQDYKKIGSNLLPGKSFINLLYNSNGNNPVSTKVSLRHQRLEAVSKPLSFPFSVPRRYEKIY